MVRPITKEEFLEIIRIISDESFSFTVEARTENAERDFHDSESAGRFKIIYSINEEDIGEELYNLDRGESEREKNAAFLDVRNFILNYINTRLLQFRQVRGTFLDRNDFLRIVLRRI